MQLEEQVTSLELSKKLKELGIKQESLFYWKTYRPDQFDKAPHPKIINFKEEPGFSEDSLYSAFTVAEFGRMFGKLMILSGYIPRFKHYSCKYFYGSTVVNQFVAGTEADARALMLIYLLENSLIEIPNRSPEKLAA